MAYAIFIPCVIMGWGRKNGIGQFYPEIKMA